MPCRPASVASAQRRRGSERIAADLSPGSTAARIAPRLLRAQSVGTASETLLFFRKAPRIPLCENIRRVSEAVPASIFGALAFGGHLDDAREELRDGRDEVGLRRHDGVDVLVDHR